MGKKVLEIINSLVDEKSFIELNGCAVSKSVNPNKISRDEKGDGVLTGYARINDRLVFVYGQDESVANGSLSKMQAQKISSLYQKAIDVGAPIIGIFDNSGFRLGEGICGMYSLGEILNMQGKAHGVIPQISIAINNCMGISAILAENSDFLFIEEKANLFLTPSTDAAGLKASDIAEKGIADFCGDIGTITSKVRGLLSFLPQNCDNNEMYVETNDDLNRQTSGISQMGTKETIITLADNNEYYEVCETFAHPATAGFIKLNGQTIGALGVTNPDKVCGHAFKKMTRLLSFCNLFHIPVLMIANAKAFHVCEGSGGDAGLLKSIFRFSKTYSEITVPKVTLIKEAYGVAGMLMGAKSMGADVVYAFENANVGIMDEKTLVEMQYEIELKSVGDKNSFINEKIDEVKQRDSLASLAGDGYVDDIIDEASTRQLLVSTFEMLYTKM